MKINNKNISSSKNSKLKVDLNNKLKDDNILTSKFENIFLRL